jgi:hypothetical protein
MKSTGISPHYEGLRGIAYVLNRQADAESPGGVDNSLRSRRRRRLEARG